MSGGQDGRKVEGRGGEGERVGARVGGSAAQEQEQESESKSAAGRIVVRAEQESRDWSTVTEGYQLQSFGPPEHAEPLDFASDGVCETFLAVGRYVAHSHSAPRFNLLIAL